MKLNFWQLFIWVFVVYGLFNMLMYEIVKPVKFCVVGEHVEKSKKSVNVSSKNNDMSQLYWKLLGLP